MTACYHQADKEAEYLVKCIAAGRELEQSPDRPPERKKELDDCHLHPARPFAYCGINIRFAPLCDRLRTISNTLKAFWKPGKTRQNIDPELLATLAEPTDIKRWLAASLDKTIRLHLHI